ncbi:MAG: 4'-phosphopantetheinyl transferase superfamily protein [Lachnospiraceae bacterium]|nr:4'-phosphopantetheinyl transferase superfamily protein [Lachnospiraceae bacterium]
MSHTYNRTDIIILEGDISIYDDEALMMDHLAGISPERKLRADRKKAPDAGKLSVLASHLIDEGLKSFGLREKDMEYGYTDKGKPYFTNIADIVFNLSHSGSRVLLCMADKKSSGIADIGCDIEKIRPFERYTERIPERFFHPEEERYIRSFDPDRRSIVFTGIWTLKESYVKALGTGISEGFDAFSVLPCDEGVSFFKEKMTDSDKKCHFDILDAPEGYCESLCVIYE